MARIVLHMPPPPGPSAPAAGRAPAGVRLDVAIVGAGLAGLALALSLDPRLRVGVFAKAPGPAGSSEWAQGGIAGAVGREDTPERHAADTVRAGAGLCDPEVVDMVARAGPGCVRWLGEMGVPFTRGSGDRLDLAREGGHSARRIAHVADTTGKAILDTLRARIRERGNVSVHDGHVAIDLRADGGACRGFYALDEAADRIVAVTASATALATGGCGKVYLYTTNPDVCTGDGIAMAWRAGCRVGNMEFVQFHPTCLYHPDARSFLVSEAVRGEGGHLLVAGERFMGRYHPDGELAPRDVVAQAIDSEMKRSGADHVDLDISFMPEAFVEERFPNIRRQCARHGIDVCAGPIPVVPAAHYLCGGIVTGRDAETDLEGLYAVGECACTGLHGANRLASNSLLECIVFAQRAARRIGAGAPAPPAPIDDWDDSRVGEPPEEVMVSHDWDELRRLMWNYVGIVRTDERLRRARKRIAILREETDDYYANYLLRRDFLELRNLVDCADIIVASALGRRESRGLHHNASCPDTGPRPESTVLARPGRRSGNDTGQGRGTPR